MGSTLTGGEKLKERARGVDASRAMRDFGQGTKVAEGFNAAMGEGVYRPDMINLKEMGGMITSLMGSGRIQVVIPMYEKGGPPDFVPRDVLKYLVTNCCIPKQNILVVNHRSEKPAVDEAKKWNVPVVNALEVISCLTTDMTEITGLSELFAGKGVAVLAGLLTVRSQVNSGIINPEYIMFHDSELVDVAKYDGARHLCYPLAITENRHNHIVGAQIDRGNEAVFAARVALEALEHVYPDDQVKKFVSDIRIPLTRLVWMLTGERILRTEDLFSLPLATGYVLETILNLGMEGINLNGSRKTTAQVVIPNARLDCCNGAWAEQCMMHMIARALNVFVLQGEPPSKWSLDRIQEINHIFGKMKLLPILPQEAGPVECKEAEADRVIPSVNAIFGENWLEHSRMESILERL